VSKSRHGPLHAPRVQKRCGTVSTRQRPRRPVEPRVRDIVPERPGPCDIRRSARPAWEDEWASLPVASWSNAGMPYRLPAPPGGNQSVTRRTRTLSALRHSRAGTGCVRIAPHDRCSQRSKLDIAFIRPASSTEPATCTPVLRPAALRSASSRSYASSQAHGASKSSFSQGHGATLSQHEGATGEEGSRDFSQAHGATSDPFFAG
jgi:hypothetical protein